MFKYEIEKVKVELNRLADAIRVLELSDCLNIVDGEYQRGRLTGAVRRASLDLTRALADLRKS